MPPDPVEGAVTTPAHRAILDNRFLYKRERIMKIFCAITAMGLYFTASLTAAGDIMKAFPLPENGQVRCVLQLPSRENESSLNVELIVGKTVQVDEINRYFFGGDIVKETIAGWGFPRYVVRELGPMAGTMMAIDPNAPKVNRFIRLGGAPYLVRYNSRLPMVIYVPEGVEVRFRIWRGEPETKRIEEG
jgi:ecotin